MEAGLLVAYASLGLMAVAPIYIGCFESLAESKRADSKSDRLSSSDAYWFPVIGSGTLFGFYILFKYFSKEYINYLLTAYFAVFGAASAGSLLSKALHALIPQPASLVHAIDVRVERQDKSGVLVDAQITWPAVVAYVLASLFTVYYVLTKNWIASNVFSLAFAISAITMIHLDSFYTGMALLAGLFVYDIFWVFGTDVMVTVAKNFDAPVKMLFPKNVFDWPPKEFALLGLGDIVIPGIFVALCLRFDDHLSAGNPAGKGGIRSKSYFHASFLAYIIGLATTITVMHTFKAAQPALLYLSPACILSVLIVAALRRELPRVFSFSTEPPVAATEPAVTPEQRKVQ